MDRSKDYIQQIAEHILKALKKGYTLDSLRFSLVSQGYSRISVEKAIELANKKLAESAPPMKEKPQIIYTIEPNIIDYKSSNLWAKIKSWFGKH